MSRSEPPLATFLREVHHRRKLLVAGLAFFGIATTSYLATARREFRATMVMQAARFSVLGAAPGILEKVVKNPHLGKGPFYTIERTERILLRIRSPGFRDEVLDGVEYSQHEVRWLPRLYLRGPLSRWEGVLEVSMVGPDRSTLVAGLHRVLEAEKAIERDRFRQIESRFAAYSHFRKREIEGAFQRLAEGQELYLKSLLGKAGDRRVLIDLLARYHRRVLGPALARLGGDVPFLSYEPLQAIQAPSAGRTPVRPRIRLTIVAAAGAYAVLALVALSCSWSWRRMRAGESNSDVSA